MMKSGKVSELRAGRVKSAPPVCVSGAASTSNQVTDPQPRCFGPPAYPEDFLEWLKTSESPARKALRGLVP